MTNPELKPCPSSLNTKHKPYLAFWNDQHGVLITPTAQVKCTCGFSGPERYGESCRAAAIVAWNTRTRPAQEQSQKTAVQCSSCGHLDYIGQEQMPLDEEKVFCVLKENSPSNAYIMSNRNAVHRELRRLSKIICAKFRVTVPAVGVEVEEIKKLVLSFNGWDKKPANGHIHDSLADDYSQAIAKLVNGGGKAE